MNYNETKGDYFIFHRFILRALGSPMKALIFSTLLNKAEYWATRYSRPIKEISFYCTLKDLAVELDKSESYIKEVIQELLKINLIKSYIKMDGMVRRRYFYFDAETELVYSQLYDKFSRYQNIEMNQKNSLNGVDFDRKIDKNTFTIESTEGRLYPPIERMVDPPTEGMLYRIHNSTDNTNTTKNVIIQNNRNTMSDSEKNNTPTVQLSSLCSPVEQATLPFLKDNFKENTNTINKETNNANLTPLDTGNLSERTQGNVSIPKQSKQANLPLKQSELNREQIFEQIWNVYDRKEGKKSAKNLFAKIKNNELQKIIDHIPFYVASTPDKKYRLLLASYLNGKRYNDEITEEQKKGVEQIQKNTENFYVLYSGENLTLRDKKVKAFINTKIQELSVKFNLNYCKSIADEFYKYIRDPKKGDPIKQTNLIFKLEEQFEKYYNQKNK